MSTLADSLVSSSSRKLPIRKRPDLKARKQRYQGRLYWVVKDPVGLQYYRFEEEEYAILLMLDGQGVYRLADSWYPVQQGDVIWMAPYCPQWFVAMGKGPARYLYYKDVNRGPLETCP